MWKIYDERVHVLKQRCGFFPDLFLWRGRQYQVHAVERCWVVSRRGWQRRVQRRFFQVQCAAGTFELFQDLREGTWHVRRALLHTTRVRAVRRPAPAWH
jgi:hypothetical protein